MIGVLIFFLFKNIFLLTGLFWLLSWVGVKFFKDKYFKLSLEYFECGFFAMTKFNLKINLNIFFVCVLLILYDVEFLFLVPGFYNLTYFSFIEAVVLIVFFLLIISSIIYDWEITALNWHY